MPLIPWAVRTVTCWLPSPTRADKPRRPCPSLSIVVILLRFPLTIVCPSGLPPKSKMENQHSDPVLKTKVENKYGRCDFERFDDVASSHMRAGHAKIGKVEIDCKFIFKKSRWGVLGPNRHPGGIIYLDLDFLQPSDCRLRSATVLVTLEEDARPTTTEPEVRSKCPVKFTDNYGPKSLSGLERVERTRRIKNFTPMVNVLGSGAGGLGVDTERMTHTASRWKFAGHITSSEGCIWYNTLRWELEENTLEAQSLHSNVIHTAFALEHNAERFYIKVNISGKLASRSDRLKSKFKFGSLTREKAMVTTMVEWRNGYHSPCVLDRIAAGLPSAMQCENLANVSMEVPDALPASFGPSATLTPATDSATESPFQMVQELSPGSPVGLLNGIQQLPQITEPEPTIENLAAAAGLLEAPPVGTGRRVPYQRSESRFSDAVTLVENGENRNGRSVGFTPKLKQVEDDDSRADREPIPVIPADKKISAPIGHLFGLLVVFSWFGNIGFLCAAAISNVLGRSLPEKRDMGRKPIEKKPQKGPPVEGRKKGNDMSDEEESAGETIASVSPIMPRRDFDRGRPRDRVSFSQAAK